MAQFHFEHGRSIHITEDSCTAAKNPHRFGSNWVFSKKDVKENEIICVSITDICKDNGRRFEIGFTDEDPTSMPIRPKTTYQLCNTKLYVPTYDLHVDTKLILMYDKDERLVFFGIDGKLKGITALYGPYDRLRWLAIKLDANILGVKINAFSDKQWNSFVLETARIAKVFKNFPSFNTGAAGLRLPVIGFDNEFDDPRGYLNDNKLVVRGKLLTPFTVFTNRTVNINEVICIRVSKVSYGSSLTIFAVSSKRYEHMKTPKIPSLIIPLTRDETIQLVCTEHGVIVQGRSSYVEASTRFAPIEPTYLGIQLTSLSRYCELEFLDPSSTILEMMVTSPDRVLDSICRVKQHGIFDKILTKSGFSHHIR